MTTMKELLDKGAGELLEDGKRQRDALRRARFLLNAGRLKATHSLGTMRRQLARTLTAHAQVERKAVGGVNR